MWFNDIKHIDDLLLAVGKCVPRRIGGAPLHSEWILGRIVACRIRALTGSMADSIRVSWSHYCERHDSITLRLFVDVPLAQQTASPLSRAE
jgi:hypothetical protein